MLTKEQLNDILSNSEFSECINAAAPHRVRIIQDITPKMKELQSEFVVQMTNAGYNGIKDIQMKLKLDKKDTLAQAEMKEWKKGVMNLFRATLKAIHPNEGKSPSIGQIYVAGKLLNYIGRNDIVNQVMQDKSISVNFKKLEDSYEYFANEDVRAVMTDIFSQADEVQGEMCKHADEIKITQYQLLPASVRYDSKTNKSGLKAGNFCTLVRHKAMGILKDSAKYTKYLNAQIESNNANVDREEIMIGKTEQM